MQVHRKSMMYSEMDDADIKEKSGNCTKIDMIWEKV